jgi:mono/diheme cytochrome c family protein
MTDERDQAGEGTARNQIDIFLDDASSPLLSATPPLSFELDTSRLEDGPHLLRIEAYDAHGVKGIRTIDFSVRNGPGIAVSGIRQDDVLDGKIPVMVNAYGGTSAVDWEPAQAETPAPPPTWAWVLLIVLVAFGIFYGVQQWSPTGEFARTPTYGTFEGAASPAEAAAAVALPAAAMSRSSTAAPAGPTSAERARGAALYSVNCAACHQDDGGGIPAVFPSLVGDSAVTDADPTEHIRIVLNGRTGPLGGTDYTSPMPPFKSTLNDADIAAIVNHERTSWGNAAPTITAADVARLRE